MKSSRRFFLMAALAGGTGSLVWPAPTRKGWQALVDYSQERGGVSLLVRQAGQSVFSQAAQAPWPVASGAKSFWGPLVCLAGLDLHETLGPTLPEWRGDSRGRITLRQLLTLSSGLEGGKPGQIVTYKESLNTLQRTPAGSRFQYGSSPFQVFGEYLRCRLGGDPLEHLQKWVTGPAGVKLNRWQRGTDGMPLMPSGAFLSAEQWACFGEFVLANHDRLRPCFAGTRANPAYGLTWWLKRPIELKVLHGIRRAESICELTCAPTVPDDLVMAAGAGDQRLYLIPSRQLVVVRQANHVRHPALRSDWSDRRFLELLFKALAL